MIVQKLKISINEAIKNGENLGSISILLKKSKMSGCSQADAIETLESMRLESNNECYEDRLLEVMDLISGYCSQNYKVWDKGK
jgi:hypothetical protein